MVCPLRGVYIVNGIADFWHVKRRVYRNTYFTCEKKTKRVCVCVRIHFVIRKKYGILFSLRTFIFKVVFFSWFSSVISLNTNIQNSCKPSSTRGAGRKRDINTLSCLLVPCCSHLNVFSYSLYALPWAMSCVWATK